MAYQIYNADGTLFATINDGTINTSTSMTLVGKNWAGYGAYIDTNFLHLLQHFSSATPPTAPTKGQIWWNSSSEVLNCWTGVVWKQFHASYTGGSAPSNPAVGDLWFDTVSGTLKAWDGTKWVTVGPSFVNGTGAISDTIIDTVSQPHNVIKFMVNNNVAGLMSQDTFTPATPIYGMSVIKPGMNMSCNIGGYGNAAGYNGCYVSVTGDVWGNTGHFNSLDVGGPFLAGSPPTAGNAYEVLISQGPGLPPKWSQIGMYPGVRLAFPMSNAPLGWTQDTTGTMNNRMMRVVTGAGNGEGGIHDPTLMNVVPDHTHVTTATSQASTAMLSLIDPAHTHGAGAGTGGGSHSHSITDPGHFHAADNGIQFMVWSASGPAPATSNRGFQAAAPNGGSYPDNAAYFNTAAAATGIQISAASAGGGGAPSISGATTGIVINDPGHVHAVIGTTDNGSSRTNWQPRYHDFIICIKN